MTALTTATTAISTPAFGSAQVQPGQHVRRHRPDGIGDDAPSPKSEGSEGPSRRNPLVAAMMSALSSLFPAQTTAPGTAVTAVASTVPKTPAAIDPASTTGGTTTTAADPAAALREAAYAFAHELYAALRGGSNGRDGESDGGHERSHGRQGGGYGDLAQRLTALATQLDSTTTAAATPEPATPAPVTTTSATPTAPAAPPAPDAPTPSAPGNGSINITININLGSTTEASAPNPPASSPLVDAFKNLLTALGNTGSEGLSPAEQLTAFLRQMARSLTTGAAPTPAVPASGGLLSVTA